jgi:hypothetical protein
MLQMSPNVKAAMREWDFEAASKDIPEWALVRAAEITEQSVPPTNSLIGDNMLYALPAGLKTRLTLEIAGALVDESVRTFAKARYDQERAEEQDLRDDEEARYQEKRQRERDADYDHNHRDD